MSVAPHRTHIDSLSSVSDSIRTCRGARTGTASISDGEGSAGCLPKVAHKWRPVTANAKKRVPLAKQGNPKRGTEPITLFIPPKEILTTFSAIAATREALEIYGFDDTYYD